MADQTVFSSRTSILQNLKRLFSHRKLIGVFARRDIRSKYSQTALGMAWHVLQPIVTLAVFTFFFGILLKVNTGDIPYVCFVFSGLMFWYNFTAIVNSGGLSLLQSQELIKKVYFPRMVPVLAKVPAAAFDFGFMLLIMGFLMLLYQIPLRPQIVLLPLLLLASAITALSAAVWLAILTVKFRDLQHIVPYLVGFGIFVTPVFFPATLIPDKYTFLIYINPMAGIIEWSRYVFFGGIGPSAYYFIGFALAIIVLAAGVFFFLSREDEMADFI